MKRILYISYDGMTDPLGQSQVINYLIGLSKFKYEFHILSFEKQEKYLNNRVYIQTLLDKHNIKWFPKIFHTKPPIISKLYDRFLILSTAKKLHQKYNYQLIHCRSYVAAEVGMYLKRVTGVKFVFDMRGFWADEKADGGSWNRKNWFWNKVYTYYKTKEKLFIKEADQIVSLTFAGKKEIENWSFYKPSTPIHVIPCCADMEHFSLISDIKSSKARKELGIPESTFVLSYLGSLGSWYMLDEMIDFYACLLEEKKASKFLIITNSDIKEVEERLLEKKIPAKNFMVINVLYKDVPKYMYASDLSISFIKPVYSKISSSPVKIGEILSMGIPLVMSNIGDADRIHNKGGALMIEGFSEKNYKAIIKNLTNADLNSPTSNRKLAENQYSLQTGIEKYRKAYAACF